MLSRSILKRSFLPQRAAASRLYTSTSTIHDNDPEVLEIEKQRNLAGKQHETSTPISEAPGWNEKLATSSEAHLRADKSKDSATTLVSKTVEYIHARDFPEDRLGSREATYERDSVEGPLKSNTAKNPGPQVTKTRVHQQILEGTTTSEEAVKADRGEV